MWFLTSIVVDIKEVFFQIFFGHGSAVRSPEIELGKPQRIIVSAPSGGVLALVDCKVLK